MSNTNYISGHTGPLKIIIILHLIENSTKISTKDIKDNVTDKLLRVIITLAVTKDTQIDQSIHQPANQLV